MKDRDEFPMLIVANKADLDKNRQVDTVYFQLASVNNISSAPGVKTGV